MLIVQGNQRGVLVNTHFALLLWQEDKTAAGTQNYTVVGLTEGPRRRALESRDLNKSAADDILIFCSLRLNLPRPPLSILTNTIMNIPYRPIYLHLEVHNQLILSLSKHIRVKLAPLANYARRLKL